VVIETESPPNRERAHHQIMVKSPWFDSLDKGERNFEVVEDRGFVLGDVVHLWETAEVPTDEGLRQINTGKRLARQVDFVLGALSPGLIFGWVVIGFGPVKSSGSAPGGAVTPSVTLLRQPRYERLAA
jgi:uncharacterized protein DUF3850